MIGELSLTRLAFQQSSNSVGAQLVEARLGLQIALGQDPTETADDAAPAASPSGRAPVLVSLMVKVLDRKA